MDSTTAKGKVAIIGSGLIGRSWAMLFVASGYSVHIYDVIPEQVSGAVSDIRERITALGQSGMLRGHVSAEGQVELLHGTTDLMECVKGVIHVQECVPELLDLKQSVFSQLDSLVDSSAVLASSTSAIPCSKFTADLQHRHRCIVAHPVNPPYYMPLVELVPAPWTDPAVVDRTRQLMIDIGQSPVVLKKEIPAFIQPRIQIAIIAECLKLIQDDVLDVDDVDKLTKDGLGLGYSFLGPFESMHVDNENGIGEALTSQGDHIHQVASSSGPPVRLDPTSPLVRHIDGCLQDRTPVEKLPQRRLWRDDKLAALAKLRRELDDSNS